MQDLKVIGVENGALLAASDDGERYRIAIDEVLQSRLRQNKPETSSGPKISPREVQAHIRSGLSADEVASVTGAPLEYVQRFEGPILAEREHIVASALSVPVRTGVDVDPMGDAANFGTVIRERLASLSAAGERWASWKEQEGGWIVKLSFTADEIDHDARWGYDQRKHALAPLNSEATTLSQQGEIQGGLIPRLRAVGTSSSPDDSRFDSGAFTFTDEADPTAAETPAHVEPVPFGRTLAPSNNSITVTAIKRADDDSQKDQHQTADLLEALRRRRGEREAAGFPDDTPAAIDVPLTDFESLEEPPTTQQAAAATGARSAGGKKGRTSLPSWDEIVFGARTDDDLA
jgi:hypothetical protein